MSSLGASIAKVGSNTLVSRVLGFIRDLVVARVFGADANTDAFFVAFRIPNVMRRLFAEGAFSMALVPVLNTYSARGDHSALRHFVDAMAGTLAAGLLMVTALGVLAAPLLIVLIAPGFGDVTGQRELAAQMLRLTFPYVLFISLTALAGAILNTYERFGIPAFTPVLLNLTLIGAALYLAPLMDRPILALAWGVLVAGMVQLAFQLPFLARLGLLPRPRLAWRDPGVRRTLRLMGPALFGASVGQVNLILGTVLASFLASGSISWLYYADRMMEFPLGILGAALGTVILPRLSQRHVADDPESFSDTIDWALRWVVLLGLPAAVGLAALALPIIASLFLGDADAQGAFTRTDAELTADALAGYSLGLLGLIAVRVLAPGYYAREQMRVPVRIGLIAVAVNLALGLLLMGPLGHVGLALATTLSALVNAGLLLWGLIAEGVYRPRAGGAVILLRVVAATALMGLALWAGQAWMVGVPDGWFHLGSGARVLRLLALILIGAAVYAGALVLLGMRPRDLRAHR